MKSRRIFACILVLVMMISIPAFTFAEGEPEMSPNSKDDAFIQRMKNKFDEPEIECWPEVRWWLAEGTVEEMFKNPGNEYRPVMRWWIPETVDEARVRAEIQEFADAGYGAIEVIPFPNGGYFGRSSAVPSGYEWDSDFWKDMYKAMVDQAIKSDIKLDLAISPCWNITSPNITSPNDQAAEVQINVGRIPLTEPFEGALPINGDLGTTGRKPKLLSVVAVKYSGDIYDFDSVMDITYLAEPDIDSATGYKISYTAPQDGGTWALFASWEMPTASRVSGYYMIDHYGKAGAESIIKYWEEELIPHIGEVDFRKAVRSIFCDSLENIGNWSRQFIDTFLDKKGYDISPYLFMLPGRYILIESIYNATYKIADTKLDEQILRDYFDVLTQCHIDYHLKPLREFCHEYGMSLRVQVVYGKTLEMANADMYVDIPETEAMGRRNTIDNFRAQAGAAHLAGLNIYAIEVQADEVIRNYQQDWDDFLFIMQRGWAGGVNTQTVHGAGYRGDFSGGTNGYGINGVTWPGYESFGRVRHSNQWQRQPSWKHAIDYSLYLARNNFVLRQGVADVDLAIYRNEYMDNIKPADSEVYLDGKYLYKDDGLLERVGFTYDFVAPANLLLETSVIESGVLCTNGPSYKALILQNQEYMSGNAAKRILEYAQNGLPIVIVGNTPTISGSKTESSTETVAAMEALLKFDNVIQVSGYDGVPNALKSLSVEPDALFSREEEVLTQHRRDNGVDYYYVYNFGRANNAKEANIEIHRDAIKPVSYDISFVGKGVPYLLDPWTGEITPIAEYNINGDRITINMELDSNESKLIALTPESWVGDTSTVYATQVSKGKAIYTNNGAIAIRSSEIGESVVRLSNGEVRIAKIESIPDPIMLDTWKLTVKDYDKGEREIDTIFDTIDVGETTLKSWSMIPGLENAAGIGTYTTTFTLNDNWEENMGAILDLGRVQDSFRVVINGNEINGCNRYTSKVDLSGFLIKGFNTVTVEVGTTLINKLAKVYPTESHRITDFGLLGNNGIVTITPYIEMSLSIADSQEDPGAAVTTPTLVETCAANLKISVADDFGKALTAYLVDEDGKELYPTTLVDKNGVMRIGKDVLTAGTYELIVKGDGVYGFCVITVKEYNTNIWEANAYVLDGKLLVKFNDDISLKSGSGCVTIGSGVYNAQVLADKRTIEVPAFDPAGQSGAKVSIKGVKYPDLFPSYSFTFTVTIP